MVQLLTRCLRSALRNIHRMASEIFVKEIWSDSYNEDNFMYIVACPEKGECAIIDPIEPEKVLAELNAIGPSWNLKYIFTTHHHPDHAGGNNQCLKLRPNLLCYGGDSRVLGVTNIPKDGEKLPLGNLTVTFLHTPCHTSGHICYLVSGKNESAVFTGDTLFIAGCGRFFEGTPKQMHAALFDKLGSLDKGTKVYCGHEYTVNNLKFARHVEPDNADVAKKLEWALKTRSTGAYTVPSTLEEEFRINPFMRVNLESVQRHAGCLNDPIATMGKLREEKNSFRPK